MEALAATLLAVGLAAGYLIWIRPRAAHLDRRGQLADEGKNLQGVVTIRPEVVGEPDGQLVVIEDCMDQSEVQVHFADGDSQDIDQEDWLDIHAEVQRTSGHGWRVATYQLDGRSRPCE